MLSKPMQRNKTFGVDNVHPKILDTAPPLFAEILDKPWEIVGEKKLIPEA